MTRYDLWWLIQPSHLMLWGLTLGALLSLRPRWRRGARRLSAVSLLALFLGAFTPASDWLIRPLEQRFPLPPADAPAPCGLIVLAGAEQVALSMTHGSPHLNGFADRLTTFITLAHRYPDARLVHSGQGEPRGAASQSTVARWILQAALPERDVLYENRSRDTQGSADEVAAMIDGDESCRWWLITSAFHMPRSMGAFNAAGVPVTAYPTDYRTGTRGFVLPQAARELGQLDWAAHEWVGLLWYRLRGDSRELFPKPRPPAVSDGTQ